MSIGWRISDQSRARPANFGSWTILAFALRPQSMAPLRNGVRKARISSACNAIPFRRITGCWSFPAAQHFRRPSVSTTMRIPCFLCHEPSCVTTSHCGSRKQKKWISGGAAIFRRFVFRQGALDLSGNAQLRISSLDLRQQTFSLKYRLDRTRSSCGDWQHCPERFFRHYRGGLPTKVGKEPQRDVWRAVPGFVKGGLIINPHLQDVSELAAE